MGAIIVSSSLALFATFVGLYFLILDKKREAGR